MLPSIADQLSYHSLALRWLGGHGFTFADNWWPATRAGEPTAHWSYLYTLYLAVVYAVFGPNPLAARLIQAILGGLLMPWLVYRITNQVFKPLKPSVIEAQKSYPDTFRGRFARLWANPRHPRSTGRGRDCVLRLLYLFWRSADDGDILYNRHFMDN